MLLDLKILKYDLPLVTLYPEFIKNRKMYEISYVPQSTDCSFAFEIMQAYL